MADGRWLGSGLMQAHIRAWSAADISSGTLRGARALGQSSTAWAAGRQQCCRTGSRRARSSHGATDCQPYVPAHARART